MKSIKIMTYRKQVAWILIALGVITGLIKSDIANLTVYRALDMYWPFFLTALGFYLLWARGNKT